MTKWEYRTVWYGTGGLTYIASRTALDWSYLRAITGSVLAAFVAVILAEAVLLVVYLSGPGADQ